MMQAEAGPDYIVAFIGATGAFPWTMELINCGLAIGNIAYSYYKQQFKRVRPSSLCPGLAPPFGPPAHPSFTSGHSFLGHLIALLLLEYRRFDSAMACSPRHIERHAGQDGRPVLPYGDHFSG